MAQFYRFSQASGVRDALLADESFLTLSILDTKNYLNSLPKEGRLLWSSKELWDAKALVNNLDEFYQPALLLTSDFVLAYEAARVHSRQGRHA